MKRAYPNWLARIEPEVIIHSAALTDVDRCEREKELAYKMNVEGTRAIATAAEKAGSFLIYISTDYVFDGQRGMYREDDRHESGKLLRLQ